MHRSRRIQGHYHRARRHESPARVGIAAPGRVEHLPALFSYAARLAPGEIGGKVQARTIAERPIDVQQVASLDFECARGANPGEARRDSGCANMQAFAVQREPRAMRRQIGFTPVELAFFKRVGPIGIGDSIARAGIAEAVEASELPTAALAYRIGKIGAEVAKKQEWRRRRECPRELRLRYR